MTVAGFTIRRILPASPVARGVGLGVVVLVMGVLVWFGLLRPAAHKETDAVMAAQQAALAHYVARDIEYKLAERSKLLTRMASGVPLALLDHPAQLQRWLAQQQYPADLFTQGIAVTDTSGRTLAEASPRPERPAMRHDDRDYLRGALTGSLTIGRPLMGRATPVPLLPMAAPVKDAAGAVRAVLVGTTVLHAPGFLTLNPQRADDEDSDFVLVSPHDRLLLASTQADQVMQPTPNAGVDTVLDRALAGFRGNDVRTNARGVEEVTAIAEVPGTPWFVLARHAKPHAHPEGLATSMARVTGVAVVLLLAVVGGWLCLDRSTPWPPALPRWSKGFTAWLTTLRGPADDTLVTYHDPLTGLPNAALLADRLGQTLARAQRNGARVGLLHINLDQFSALNASLGHDAGNLALAEIGRRLSAIVRETDTLARVGSDTFVVLLGELDSAYEPAKISACAVAAKCLDAVAPTLTLNSVPYQLGASVGIALSAGQTDPDALQSAAARAMYHAKQVGGDRYFVAPAAIPASPAIANA